MRRDEALMVLKPLVTDEVVVAVYQACFDWMRLAPRDLNYVSTGAMGLASSHALGVALGRPDKRVLVFDGDGSLLMNLGSLVTIAEAAPQNLVHFVFRNGNYEANGSHPLPNAQHVDFCSMAKAAGYRAASEYRDLDGFAKDAPGIIKAVGPALVTLHVVPGAPSPQDYSYIHSHAARQSFRRALARSAPRT